MFSANSLIRHDANEDATPEVEIKSTEKANGGENSNIRDEGYSGRNDRLKVKGELEMKTVSLAKGGEKLVGFDLEVDDLPKLTDAVVEKENALAVPLPEGQEARKMCSTSEKDFSANSIQQVGREDALEVEIKSPKKENGGENTNTRNEGYNDINMWMRLFGPKT